MKDAWSGQPICYDSEALTAGTQFTCFTGTKVQTLTQLRQGLKAVLALHSLPSIQQRKGTLICAQRLEDCVNVLLSYQNADGGWWGLQLLVYEAFSY